MRRKVQRGRSKEQRGGRSDEEEGATRKKERRGRSDEDVALRMKMNKNLNIEKKMKKIKIEKVAEGRIVDHSVSFFITRPIRPTMRPLVDGIIATGNLGNGY